MGFFSDLFGGKDAERAPLTASEKQLQAIQAELGRQQLTNVYNLQGLQGRLVRNLVGNDFVNEELFGAPTPTQNDQRMIEDLQGLDEYRQSIEGNVGADVGNSKKGLLGNIIDQLSEGVSDKAGIVPDEAKRKYPGGIF